MRIPGQVIEQTREAIRHVFLTESKRVAEEPTYDLDDLRRRLRGQREQMARNAYEYKTDETVDVLLERGVIEKGPGRFALTRDFGVRARPPLNGDFAVKEKAQVYSKIECPFLIVKSDCDLADKLSMPENYKLMSVNMPKDKFHFRVAKNSAHHEHPNVPEKIFAVIRPFLDQL